MVSSPHWQQPLLRWRPEQHGVPGKRPALGTVAANRVWLGRCGRCLSHASSSQPVCRTPVIIELISSLWRPESIESTSFLQLLVLASTRLETRAKLLASGERVRTEKRTQPVQLLPQLRAAVHLGVSHATDRLAIVLRYAGRGPARAKAIHQCDTRFLRQGARVLVAECDGGRAGQFDDHRLQRGQN